MQTHEICHGNCRRSYTQYNGHEIEQEAQQCVTDCDDWARCPLRCANGIALTATGEAGTSGASPLAHEQTA